jgi:UDP-N-acetylmuramyl tripeptide synthase
MLALQPALLSRLAANRDVVVVSGTNGKTTTTKLIAAALGDRGLVASNVGGANMTAGVATALAAKPRTAPAVLEVDELYLPRVAPLVAPKVVVLLNITRDQLDRSNETRRIAAVWRALGGELADATVVANVDDPLVVWAALGFSRRVWVAAGQRWALDATVCPACGGLLIRADGGWSCKSCDLCRPEPSVVATRFDQIDIDAVSLPVRLALPGLVNTGNAAIALAAVGVLGMEPAEALVPMSEVSDVQGRYREIVLGGRPARLLLAKNPAGWLEMLELLDETPARPLVIHFHARIADGRDPSWIWDVPLDRLAGRDVHICGERAEDVGVRLAYAGIAYELHGDPAAAAAACAGDGPIDVLATYTAFRELLTASGGLR